MKKFTLCLLVCFVIATGAFAEGTFPGNDFLSIGGQLSQPFTHQTTYGTTEWITDVFYSIGPGVEVLWLKDNKIGVFGTVDFYFPLYQMSNVFKVSNAKILSADAESYNRKGDLKDSFGVSFLVGPSIRLAGSSKGLFTINPGLHYNMTFWKDDMDSKDFMLGVGLNLQYKFFLAPHFFLSFCGDLVWDFLIVKNAGSSSTSKPSFSTISFNNPKFGLGYFF